MRVTGRYFNEHKSAAKVRSGHIHNLKRRLTVLRTFNHLTHPSPSNSWIPKPRYDQESKFGSYIINPNAIIRADLRKCLLDRDADFPIFLSPIPSTPKIKTSNPKVRLPPECHSITVHQALRRTLPITLLSHRYSRYYLCRNYWSYWTFVGLIDRRAWWRITPTRMLHTSGRKMTIHKDVKPNYSKAEGGMTPCRLRCSFLRV
jgi:hypothetical protein